MNYLSTTALANTHGIRPAEAFAALNLQGWMSKIDGKWKLTELGHSKGGRVKSDSIHGEYITWPNTAYVIETLKAREQLLTSTVLSEHFRISSQRMNLILSELGWIQKSVSGWNLTQLGTVFSGKQMEHDLTGKTYVLWPRDLLTNQHLVKALNETGVSISDSSGIKVEQDNAKDENLSSFRQKYEATNRCIDGHLVKSKSEMIVDNWLYHYGIVHAYERKLPVNEEVYSDFYIPSGNGRPNAVYIEYWGLEGDAQYEKRKIVKQSIYTREGLQLIELNDRDIKNIDDVLPRKLLRYNIKVA